MFFDAIVVLGLAVVVAIVTLLAFINLAKPKKRRGFSDG